MALDFYRSPSDDAICGGSTGNAAHILQESLAGLSVRRPASICDARQRQEMHGTELSSYGPIGTLAHAARLEPSSGDDQHGETAPAVVPSAGGLATGLRAPHERSGGLWFGWPGDVRRFKPEQRADLDAQLRAMRLVPIHLTPAEVERYYFGFSNSVLWPLFHYLLDQMPMDTSDWDEYVHVNERFAETVRQQYQEGDLIWVHDYQLMLLPQMLRQRLPAARIGFFLHIPFPSSEVFRILPWRTEVLQGLLGADLIGFHTVTYQRHFSMSLLRLLGLEADVNSIWHEGREVRLGVYPMGIDTESFEKLVASPEVRAEAQSLRKESKGAAIILCVDRLDYTKGSRGGSSLSSVCSSGSHPVRARFG
jgi:trehalose 6-phosphate synthase/phosphatase